MITLNTDSEDFVDFRNPKFYITGLFLLIGGIVLKSYYISDYSLWYDESVSLFHVQKNILRVFEYSALDNTPPIYNLFLHLWIKIFGVSEFAIRFPSVIFSSIAGLGIFYLGFRRKSFWAGLLAALIFTFNNFNLWYAQDARCYAMVSMFAVLSIIIFENWVKDKSTKNTKYLIIINCLLLYTHYITFFLFAGQALFIFLFEKSEFRKYLNLMLRVAGIFGIWSIAMIRNLITINKGFWIPSTTTDTLSLMLKEVGGSYWQFGIIAILLVLGYFFQKNQKKEYLFLIFSIVIPVVLLLGVSLITPLFITRYLIYIFPFIALGLAYAITEIFPFKVLNYCFGLGLLLSLSYGVSIYQDKGDDMRSLVKTIKENEVSNRAIILQTDMFYGLFTYYYDREGLFRNPYEIKYLMKDRNILGLNGMGNLDKMMVDDAEQVILVNLFNLSTDPGQQVKAYIKSNHSKNDFKDSSGVILVNAFSK